MARTPEQFEQAMLDLLQEIRYGRPSYLDEFNKHHLCREGAWVYALEHCVFGAHFPRWLANVTGKCPVLEVRKYLIENLFVEEVRDPTIISGHHESLVDFAVALGLDRDYVMTYEGSPLTRIRKDYFEHVSLSRPWIVAFAAVCSGEMTRGTKMYKRIGERARTTRAMWAPLKLAEKDLAHWDAAEEADCGEGGHGDMPYELLKKYATVQEEQDACLAAMADFQTMTRMWSDQVGVWAFEAAGLTPPPLTGRLPLPQPKWSHSKAA
jgi:pyrroloquinoline quinone (PQQ) biosynthesis protein C